MNKFLAVLLLVITPALVVQADNHKGKEEGKEKPDRVVELHKAIDDRKTAFEEAKDMEDDEARKEAHREARDDFWDRVEVLFGDDEDERDKGREDEDHSEEEEEPEDEDEDESEALETNEDATPEAVSDTEAVVPVTEVAEETSTEAVVETEVEVVAEADAEEVVEEEEDEEETEEITEEDASDDEVSLELTQAEKKAEARTIVERALNALFSLFR